MMKTFLVISLVLFGMLAIGGIAVAKTKGTCHGLEGRMNRIMERVTKKLNLDEDQQTRLGTVRDKLVDMRESMSSSRRETRQALSELLAAPQLDRTKAQSYISGGQAVFSAGSQEVLDAFAQFSDSLNAEQRDKLIDWVENFRHHRFGQSHGHL